MLCGFSVHPDLGEGTYAGASLKTINTDRDFLNESLGITEKL